MRRSWFFAVALQLDQPKVEELRAGLGQHHVAGFQIAVDRAVPMAAWIPCGPRRVPAESAVAGNEASYAQPAGSDA
jgi:hypothetical protein